jgi:hypothetical protein
MYYTVLAEGVLSMGFWILMGLIALIVAVLAAYVLMALVHWLRPKLPRRAAPVEAADPLQEARTALESRLDPEEWQVVLNLFEHGKVIGRQERPPRPLASSFGMIAVMLVCLFYLGERYFKTGAIDSLRYLVGGG